VVLIKLSELRLGWLLYPIPVKLKVRPQNLNTPGTVSSVTLWDACQQVLSLIDHVPASITLLSTGSSSALWKSFSSGKNKQGGTVNVPEKIAAQPV
jgi:hypothetical protein